LSLLDEPESEFVLAIDLAPGDGIADWLLEAMGVANVATALRLPPVHTDAFGRLFHFGDRLSPSVFVVVRDCAVEADGTVIEHWICVPPHMVTAREAVAWTFGMTEQAYRPVRET
jgi:hypothetical protein